MWKTFTLALLATLIFAEVAEVAHARIAGQVGGTNYGASTIGRSPPCPTNHRHKHHPCRY